MRYFKFILIALLLVALLLLINNVQAASNDFALCNKQCINETRNAVASCEQESKLCNKNCIDTKRECNSVFAQDFRECKETCDSLIGNSKGICLRECSINYSIGRKTCNDVICKDSCQNSKKICKQDTNLIFGDCSLKCRNQNNNITCGNYSAGDIFADKCNKCKCGFDGKIKCIQTPFCNFNSITIDESYCTNNGGFYHNLCKSIYYDMLCSEQKYCQCGGFNNYTCPSDYTCVKNFMLPAGKFSLVKEWRSPGGIDLGDIGICAKNPELNSCGNGICENIVCLSLDCPKPETKFNCPNDCS